MMMVVKSVRSEVAAGALRLYRISSGSHCFIIWQLALPVSRDASRATKSDKGNV